MQLSYDSDTPVGVEGQKIESYESAAVTGTAEAGTVPVGKLVVMDTTAGRSDKAVRSPTSSGDITGPAVVGVTQWDPTYPEPPYRQFALFPVLRKGRILLKSEDAVAKGTRPFVRFASGAGGNVLGSIRSDADGATAEAAPYLTVITTAPAGGLCVVEVNL